MSFQNSLSIRSETISTIKNGSRVSGNALCKGTVITIDMARKYSRPRAPKKRNTDKLQQKKLARVNTLCQKLVGDDTFNAFADNCASTVTDWHSLLCKTTLSTDIRRTDPSITAAFKAVDNIITWKEGTYLLRRLAYIQLMRIFTSLESIIKGERDKAQVERLPCYRASSVAMDIYVSCQEEHSSQTNLRDKLKERKRTGRSWVQLAGPSPVLALLYSEVAEPTLFVRSALKFYSMLIIRSRDFKRTDRASITLIAATIHSNCPQRMIEAADVVTNAVESAVRSNAPLSTNPGEQFGQIAADIKGHLASEMVSV